MDQVRCHIIPNNHRLKTIENRACFDGKCFQHKIFVTHLWSVIQRQETKCCHLSLMVDERKKVVGDFFCKCSEKRQSCVFMNLTKISIPQTLIHFLIPWSIFYPRNT